MSIVSLVIAPTLAQIHHTRDLDPTGSNQLKNKPGQEIRSTPGSHQNTAFLWGQNK